MEFLPGTTAKAKKEAEKIRQDFEIDDPGGLHLLASFAAALSTELSCQKQIKKEGQTVLDRFNQAKSHPLFSVLRDARSQKLAALKQLNLDIEPLEPKPGRPAGR
jgi:hypothetical protein